MSTFSLDFWQLGFRREARIYLGEYSIDRDSVIITPSCVTYRELVYCIDELICELRDMRHKAREKFKLNQRAELITISADEILDTDWPIKIWIYALVDPRDRRIRYIGQSKDVESRLYQHIHKPLNSTRQWIVELRDRDLEPQLIVLDLVEKRYALDKEADWIKIGFDRGWPLLNVRWQNGVS